MLVEHKTTIRHEKNATKIMEMENEAMLRMTAMERDNLHKLQQISALKSVTETRRSNAFASFDPTRKSKSLSKTLGRVQRECFKTVSKHDETFSDGANPLDYTLD